MQTQTAQPPRPRTRRLLLVGVTLGLLALGPAAFAAAVPYPVVVTDTSGVRVTGATFAINGTTLTPGTPATVTGKNLSTGATVSSASVTEVELSNGAYSIVYDAAATGEAYFPLTVTKAGSTIASVYDMVCSADSTTIASASTSAASAATTSTSNGTAIGVVTSRLGVPVNATFSLDIAGIPSTTGFANTITNVLTAAGLSPANATKVLAFAAALNASTGAVPLPATPPTGYGGTGGGAPVVHR